MIIDFPNNRRTHCETGSIKNLLRFYGFDISEEMIFGIGSGLYFFHFPYLIIDGVESSFFRSKPGSLFSCLSKRLKIKYYFNRIKSKKKFIKIIDNLLDRNIPVGIVANLHKLPYFANDGNYRELLSTNKFQINGHNLIVIGKEKDTYFISDSNNSLENVINTIKTDELIHASHTQKSMSLNGIIYHVKSVPNFINLKKGIVSGIKITCRNMLDIPFKFFGIKGLRYLAKNMREWEKLHGRHKTSNALWRIVFKTEMEHTGGGAYRFMYSQFLKEAGELLHDDNLLVISEKMRKSAEMWQLFSLEAVRYYKKSANYLSINELASIIDNIANHEEKIFKELKNWTKS